MPIVYGHVKEMRDSDRLSKHGIEVCRVKFPWGMDANEYARKVTPAAKSLQLVLKAAEWVGGTAAPSLMRNVQRLLEPLDVMNPWADDLTFTTEQTRTRRDNEKYLGLIESVALLHQHQRPRELDPEDADRSAFIRVTLGDIELANRLARELLGRSLDELPPQSRRLLETIKSLVKTVRREQHVEQRLALFSRRDLQAACGWSYSQIKRHLSRLQELEYVAPRFGRMGATLRYELLVDADEPDGVAHIGLLDIEKLRKSTATTATWTGPEVTLTPPCRNAHLEPRIGSVMS